MKEIRSCLPFFSSSVFASITLRFYSNNLALTTQEDNRCAAQVAAEIEKLEDMSRDNYYSETDAMGDAFKGDGPMGWASFLYYIGFAINAGKSINYQVSKKYGWSKKVTPEGTEGDVGLNSEEKKVKKKKKKKGKGKTSVEGGYEEELKAGGMHTEDMDLEPDRVPAPDAGILQSKLQQLPAEDDALTKIFALESKCQCHFQLLVSVAAVSNVPIVQCILIEFVLLNRYFHT